MDKVNCGDNRARISVIDASLQKLVTVRADTIRRGEIISSAMHFGRPFAVLISGLACIRTRHEDGSRQIYAFHHPGDFLALHTYLNPEFTELVEVEALSNCTVGTIDRVVLEGMMQVHSGLSQALWRAAMIEASIFRQRLVMVRRPAQQRIAHLLCEQMFRLGPRTSIIPLTQIDVADAVGLSVVHTNRIFQELRQLGVLSANRGIEILNKKHLQELAAFDGRYLDPGETLSRWDLCFET